VADFHFFAAKLVIEVWCGGGGERPLLVLSATPTKIGLPEEV
jgi:hypothetical protein